MNTTWDGKAAPRILLIEDEPMLRDTMMSYLNIDGFHCQSVGSLAGFRAFRASGQSVDVVVFDLGLPDGDGLEALGAFAAANPGVRIVIASAKGSVEQRIEGLNKGADAYLPKPINLIELSVILKKLARQAKVNPISIWSLDSKSWRLKAPSGDEITLTLREKLTLELTMKQPGLPVSRDVLAKAWGFDPLIYDFRRMESTLRRLRKKCQDELGCPLPLITIYGLGFVFNSVSNQPN